MSRNAVFSLEGLECLQELEELSLYFNNIQTLKEISSLRCLIHLTELDLRLNPLTRTEENYKQDVIHFLPNLLKLDLRPVRAAERNPAKFDFISQEQYGTLEVDKREESQQMEKVFSYDTDGQNYVNRAQMYKWNGVSNNQSAQLKKNSSEPTQNISVNCEGSPASTHMQANQSEKLSSSKDRIQQFVQSRAHNASVPQSLNRPLFGATIENGISGEHLSTGKQDNVHKLNNGIFPKDASSLSNDAMSEPKYHKTSGVASCQNSANFFTLASLNKAHLFSLTDNCSDRAPLQRSCRQVGITPFKETACLEMACDHNGIPSSKYASKVYNCPETLTGASSDISESPERDEGSYVVNFEATNCHKIDTSSFRPTDRNTCHLDEYSMTIKCSKLSAASTPSSYTNMQRKPFSIASGIAQLCPSAASDISSFSVDENAFSGLHIEQKQEDLNPVLAINNSAQLGSRTETCVSNLTKGCSQKKHPLFMPQNTNNIQQDSGFDSPFFNFH